MDPDTETHQDANAISICAFAADIMAHLDDDNASFSSFSTWMQEADVSQTLATTMETLPVSMARFSSRSLRLLDSSATALWNAFARFSQRVGGLSEVAGLGVRVPLLVCCMLECCCSEDGDSGYGLWKLFQVFIKSAEICLGLSMIVEVTDLLRRATMKVNFVDLSEMADPDSLDYLARYHFLCTWMALKNEDIKEFDVHFPCLPQDVAKMSPGSREQYASICLSAFRLAAKHDYRKLAESLLQKLSETLSILRQCQHEVLEYKKLVSGFFYVLATADLKDMSETFSNLRNELLQTTEQDLKGPLGLFLQLEVMSRQEFFNKEVFYQSLIKYIEIIEPTKDKFKRCLQYIFKLRAQDPDHSMMALRLLYRRIHVFTNDESWLQQNFVSLLRLVPSLPWRHTESLQFLTDLATTLNELLVEPLSTAASNAALIVVWKYIESACSNSDYLEAQAWCRFCQNKLFDRAIPKNKANVLRKSMDCSFQTGTYVVVKSAWELLSKQERDSTTIHIMYQVSLRDSDIGTAASLLASLIELENGEHRYALATAAAAVTVSSQLRRKALQSVYTLTKEYPIVLKKKPINLDLHRALIRLMVYELREGPDDVEALRTQMCEVLTWVKRAISQEPSGPNDHDWFVRCTYMLLLESRDWAASQQLLILGVCFKLIDMYPKDVGIDVKHEINRRRISCNLLGMLIYTNMARAEQSTETKKTYYLVMTGRYVDIQNVMASFPDRSDVTQYLDATIIERYHEILCFYLEAVIYLEQWPAVEAFIRTASTIDNDHARSIMADMILTSAKMPIDHIIRSLQDLLNSLGGTDTKRLSFIRCIFDLCLHHRRNDIRIRETILNQALATAQDTASTEDNCQDEELEYLSTKSFNYAVDLYLTGQQTDAQRWARKAIELSELMRDDYGHLALSLQVKYEKWLTYDMGITSSSS